MDAVISIRDAQEKDAAQLANLLHTLFSIEADFKPDMEKQKAGLSMLISQPEHGVIKAAFTEDGKLIGMVSAQLVISTAQGALSAWVEDMVVMNNGQETDWNFYESGWLMRLVPSKGQ